MKFKVVDESFKKYAPKDPERMDNHMGDETPEDIYNELKKEEFEKEGFTKYKKHTGTLQNMESMEAVTTTVDIHVLMNLTRVLNELIEIIESGKFDVIENPKK